MHPAQLPTSLRPAFHESLRHLDDVSARAVLERELGADDLEALEGIGQDITNFLKRSGPRMLSGALAGATTGSALGPIGTGVGAAAGALLGAVSKPAAPAPAPVAVQAPAPVAAQAQTQARPSTPVASSAPTALLQVLNRPEVVQALLALAMGRAGATQVKVGGETLAPVAVVGALAQLAQRAVEEHYQRQNADAEVFAPGDEDFHCEFAREEEEDLGSPASYEILEAFRAETGTETDALFEVWL